MDLKRLALGGAIGALALALWLRWLWQPERQVRLHTDGLIKALERRNWNKVQHFLADNYSDRWGHDKGFVLSGLREVFGSFVFLNIEHDLRTIELDLPTRAGASGDVVARVKISGQGSVVAQYVMAKVNGLSEPFTFTWEHRSGKPWDWQLTAVDHPTLDPDAVPQF